MSGSLRLRLVGALAAGAAGLAALGTGHWAAQRAARDWATRSAETAAAYLALVTPTAPGSTTYDLARLLAQARGLSTLPGWGRAVEVYHGTAPLVRATAAPLDAAAFAALREREIVQALGDARLVPFKDKDDWDVVGAVAVRAGDVTPSLLSGWTIALLVGLGVMGALAADRRWSRRAVVVLGLAAVLVGLTGYRIAVTGARTATDHWLERARCCLRRWRPGRRPVAPPLRPHDCGPGARRNARCGRQRRHRRAAGRGGRCAAGLHAVPRGQRPVAGVERAAGEATAGGWLAVTLAWRRSGW
jgi:hypothetical protein